MDWKFEWVTTWEAIKAPGFQAWRRRLYESDTNATVFANPDLCWAWIEACGAERNSEPRFLVGRTGGVEALLPLLLSRRGRWQDAFPRILQAYGDFDYQDPLFSTRLVPEAVASFWPAAIVEVDRTHRGAADVLKIWRLHGTTCPGAVPSEPALSISLRSFADYESLLAGLGKQMRQDMRRQRRRLCEHGSLRLVVAPDTASALAWLPDFLQAHRARWGRGKPDGFYVTLIRKCLPSGLVQLSSLEVGQQPISWCMGFVDPRRFYYYKPAYAKEWANYSPGKIHLNMLVEWSIANGLATFDFLTGNQSYKLQWMPSSETLYHLWHRVPGMRSRAVAGIHWFMRAVGKRASVGRRKAHVK